MKPISKMSLAEREAHAGHEWKELLDWNTNEWFKINEELKKKGGMASGLDGPPRPEFIELDKVYYEKLNYLTNKYFGDLPQEEQMKARISPKKMTEETLTDG